MFRMFFFYSRIGKLKSPGEKKNLGKVADAANRCSGQETFDN